MTPEQFVYWLQGFIEVENPKAFSAKQTQIVKDHLEKVFKKVTPNRHNEENPYDLSGIAKRLNRVERSTSGSRRIC